jgi:acetoacetate decarboxylase
MAGQFWMGFPPVTDPVTVPPDVRYTAGTLTYNELAVGPLVRRGARTGALAHHIWVDNPASLWGGRQLWGIPKQLAEFIWRKNTLSVNAAGQQIVTFELDPTVRGAFRTPIPGTGFGELDGQRMFLPGRAIATVGLTRLTITAWQDPLPNLSTPTDLPVLAGRRSRFTFPGGRNLSLRLPRTTRPAAR